MATKRKAEDAEAQSRRNDEDEGGPLVIGITGASQSGKTTVTQLLAERLRSDGLHVEVLSQDNSEFRKWRTADLPQKDGSARISWEGPQFTAWDKLETAVLAPRARATVLLVEGYMLLDCTPGTREALTGLLWVDSSVEICAARRKTFPSRKKHGSKGWESSVAYVRNCIWPAHQAYEQRCFPLIEWDVKGTEHLKTAACAPVEFLPAGESADERSARAAACVRKWCTSTNADSTYS